MEGSSAQAICSRRLRRGQIVRALAQLAHSRRRRRRERPSSPAAMERQRNSGQVKRLVSPIFSHIYLLYLYFCPKLYFPIVHGFNYFMHSMPWISLFVYFNKLILR